MRKDIILVLGAGGQIGVDLTLALRKYYGDANVFAADIREENYWLKGTGPYLTLDVLNTHDLKDIIRSKKITQLYLLAATLSATGEQNPKAAWNLNMQSLIQVLDIAKELKLDKVFWPSSIAVFGPESPKRGCSQQAALDPTTMYGISKQAGERWCRYYFDRYGVDVRSLRYPGLISYRSAPGGGTTDYAVDIFHQALTRKEYTCFLEEDTALPMMYMPDAIRATIQLMEAPSAAVRVRTSYNIAALSFTPAELAAEIKKQVYSFTIQYKPDYRQAIADTWPGSIDDSAARLDWNWNHRYDLQRMTVDMLEQIQELMFTPLAVNH